MLLEIAQLSEPHCIASAGAMHKHHPGIRFLMYKSFVVNHAGEFRIKFENIRSLPASPMGRLLNMTYNLLQSGFRLEIKIASRCCQWQIQNSCHFDDRRNLTVRRDLAPLIFNSPRILVEMTALMRLSVIHSLFPFKKWMNSRNDTTWLLFKGRGLVGGKATNQTSLTAPLINCRHCERSEVIFQIQFFKD